MLALTIMALCAACAPIAQELRAAAGPAAPAGAGNGAILERAPCRVNTDPRAFSQMLDTYFRDDILKAGLEAELAARPLLASFTQAENLRLAAAARAGRCERVLYRSGGLRVAGFVLQPAGPGPHPVLIWLRGGHRSFGMIEQTTLLDLQYLAEAGFIVVAPQYRGVDGGQGVDEFGGADVDDVLALVPLAGSLPGADIKRLYLLGGSRGAMQGTVAMRRGLPVRAAVFRGGVFDLKALMADRPVLENLWQTMMPDLATDRAGALERRSAVSWAAELKAPVLIFHGRQDWRTRVEHSITFAQMLSQAGVVTKVIVYERDEHQLALHRPQWLGEAVSWFRTHGAFETPLADQP